MRLETLKLNTEAAQRFINHALSDALVDKEKENKEPENKKKDKESKPKTKKEETTKSNKRQSPDKVTAESTDKKKRRK